MTPHPKVPLILRLLYNHNPFYVLSALLLLYALKLSFRPGEVAYIDPWLLAGAIAGYISVMTLTGYLVVRLGKVWEDARSIFLVILLMFLAGAVSLDELLNLYPQSGRWLLIAGLAIVVAVTETVLRSLGIRLPAAYRVPYYAWWALCFLFPLVAAPDLTGLDKMSTAWRLAAFPPLAGLIVLSLIPAVRRGAEFVARNGTPWGWPLYPWTLFVFLGLAVCFRSYALTISFLPLDGLQTAFCTYFLVPFALCLCVLLLEFALGNRSRAFQRGVLWASSLCLGLAFPWTNGDPVSAAFLNEWTTRLASPLYLTALSLAGLAIYAELRRAAGTDLLMAVSLCGLSAASPTTVDVTFTTLHPLPLILLTGWFMWRAVHRGRSFDFLVAGACAVLVAASLPATEFAPGTRRLFIYHLALGATLGVALLTNDPLGRALRVVTAIWLPASAWVVLQIGPETLTTRAAFGAYIVGLFLCAACCWWITRERAYLVSGAAMLSGGAAGGGWMAFRYALDVWGPVRVLALAGSAASFILAVGISALKAGVLERVVRKRLTPAA